jgi:glycerol-3-phosphate acyltransferase PlsX
MRIALDAMGGDNAPGVTLEGAVETVNEFDDIDVILVGKTDVLEAGLGGKRYPEGRITIKHASEVVGMEETAAVALRKKKDSSIKVAVDLVKNGQADAVVSAGHSGVAMATSLLALRKCEGVDRPAIATMMPTINGSFLLVDAGANVDCAPANLLQFAYMGSAYCRIVQDIKEPRVALLSIGEEDTKGNELTKAVFHLLKKSCLNFVGNIEGKDIFGGSADVVVCDGFVGNTVLKVSEGLADAVIKILRDEITKSLSRKLGYMLLKPAFRHLKKRTDYDEYGGAPLLGINGISIISHGRSSPKAIKNALKVANQLSSRQIHKVISEEIRRCGG